MATEQEPPTKSINCPACGAPITLRALGACVMVACPSCQTQIDVSKPEIEVIKKYRLTEQQFDLALGARGALRGKTYEVIGAMIRSSDDGNWTEYLLFNPFAGFRWLIQDGGHWSLGETVKDSSAVKAGYPGVSYRGLDYRKFSSGKAVVETVVGEFYWRVRVGNQADTIDYVAAPWMLSKEKTGTELTWTLIQYLEPNEIESAFGISVESRDSIAPHQPNPLLSLQKHTQFLTKKIGTLIDASKPPTLLPDGRRTGIRHLATPPATAGVCFQRHVAHADGETQHRCRV